MLLKTQEVLGDIGQCLLLPLTPTLECVPTLRIARVGTGSSVSHLADLNLTPYQATCFLAVELY